MQKVRIYWNLHKKVWSVQDIKSNKVVAHRQFVTIRDAKFVVRKGGQKRVREEGKKNVHAFAVGYMTQIDNIFIRMCDWDRVKYNPYTDDYFIHKGEDHDHWNDIPRDWAGWVHMESLHHEHGIAPRVYI